MIQGTVIAIGGLSHTMVAKTTYWHIAVAIHHDSGGPTYSAYNFCVDDNLRSLAVGDHVQIAYEAHETCDILLAVNRQ